MTAFLMRISDLSSDLCSSDLLTTPVMMSSRSPTSSNIPTSTIEVLLRDPSEPDLTSTLMQPWWYQGWPSGGSIQTLPPLWRMKKTASEHSGHFVRMQQIGRAHV